MRILLKYRSSYGQQLFLCGQNRISYAQKPFLPGQAVPLVLTALGAIAR